MMSRDDMVAMHDALRAHKEHCWYVHNDNDMPPQLTVRWRDMPPQGIDMTRILAYFAQQQHRFPPEQREQLLRPARIIYSVLKMLDDGVYPPELRPPPTKDTPLEFIGVGLEGFSKNSDEEVDVDIHVALENMGIREPGDIQHDFETNPASDVVETITTYAAETGPLGLPEWSRVTSKLHKGDAGRIEWEEHEIHTSEDEDPGYRHDVVLAVITRFVRRESLT